MRMPRPASPFFVLNAFLILKSHRLKTFKISNDPHFADKVVDVLGFYLNPRITLWCYRLNEKTQIRGSLGTDS